MVPLEILHALAEFKAKNPTADKAGMEAFFTSITRIVKTRSVFSAPGYAIRFSQVNSSSFSNVVLSLSRLGEYDRIPVIICIVRPDYLEFRLANATFLKRISHSSHALSVQNIVGSFLGNDIVDYYDGLPNSPPYFDQLFARHVEFTWAENVERLVEATQAIVPRSTRYTVTPENVKSIEEAPKRALEALSSESFRNAENHLSNLVMLNRDALLHAAAIDNINIRGNYIEQIIAGAVNSHRLDDFIMLLENGGRLVIDIKTKLLDRASAPKAYNVDKMLTLLSDPGTVFAFFFVGLSASQNICQSRLVSMFDPILIQATRIQTHWAGRSSRGVTQLTGDISPIFNQAYRPSVDIPSGVTLLRSFIER